MSTHGPIEGKHRKLMNRVARALDKRFKGYGFALFVFDFDRTDGGGRVNYISNGRREDMIVAVKEWIARAEGMDPPKSEARQ